MPKYKIADVIFETEHIYDYVPKEMKDYLYTENAPAELTINLRQEDIDFEKNLAPDIEDKFLESIALYRKLCDYILLNKQGLIFHCSAIAVGGNAYLFTAPSGTGKSTHAKLWRNLLGDKAVMINDDKPIIRYIDGEFYVYGTPWDGKHHLSTNTRAKVKGICRIAQAKDNKIFSLTPSEMLITVLTQTALPKDEKQATELFNLIDKLLGTVKLYHLDCNISEDAAKLSYNTMTGDNL